MGLSEDIKELKELVIKSEVQKNEKKFKFPFGKKVTKAQKSKNYVTVLLLNENGIYCFKKSESVDLFPKYGII